MANTMIKGVLKTWKEDRGFGFIKPDDGGKDIFIHISALNSESRRPITGDVIHYQITKDNRGKYKAINAQIEGVTLIEKKSSSSKANPNRKWILALSAGLLLTLVAVIFLYKQ